jgi:hypothetical protein
MPAKYAATDDGKVMEADVEADMGRNLSHGTFPFATGSRPRACIWRLQKCEGRAWSPAFNRYPMDI